MPNLRLVSDFPPRDVPCGPGRYPNAMYERLRRFPGAGQNDRREGWKCNGTPHRKRLGWRRDHVPPAIGPVIRWPCCGARIGRMVGEQATIHPRPTRTTSNPAGLYRTEPASDQTPLSDQTTPAMPATAASKPLEATERSPSSSIAAEQHPSLDHATPIPPVAAASEPAVAPDPSIPVEPASISGTPGGGGGSDTAGKSAAPTRAATGRAIGNASKLRDRSGAGVAHARHSERGACTLADQAPETA